MKLAMKWAIFVKEKRMWFARSWQNILAVMNFLLIIISNPCSMNSENPIKLDSIHVSSKNVIPEDIRELIPGQLRIFLRSFSRHFLLSVIHLVFVWKQKSFGLLVDDAVSCQVYFFLYINFVSNNVMSLVNNFSSIYFNILNQTEIAVSQNYPIIFASVVIIFDSI